MELKLMLAIALVGHALCWYCDRLLMCTSAGKFTFSIMKDNARMQRVFRAMNPKAPTRSIVLGVPAIAMEGLGCLALSRWMEACAPLAAKVMLVGGVLTCAAGGAHHVLCGAAEWLYIRGGCTEEAQRMTTDFFARTAATMILCYVGIMAFSVALLVPVVAGATPLPAWACAFNLLPLFLALAPFHVAGAGNIAGVIMYAGLLILL